MYVFNQMMMTMNDKFRTKIIENYQKNKTYKKLLFILRELAASIKKKYIEQIYTHENEIRFAKRINLLRQKQ